MRRIFLFFSIEISNPMFEEIVYATANFTPIRGEWEAVTGLNEIEGKKSNAAVKNTRELKEKECLLH